MKIYKNLNIKKIHKKSVVAIGNFDGIHSGHKKVLEQARQKAKKKRLKFGLITFEPIPTMFFNSNIKHHRINSLDQKILYLKKIDLDFLVIIKFDKKFSNYSAEEFIKKIIFNKLACKHLFVSKNFKFGKKRSGNVNTLKKFEIKYFYKTMITVPYKKNNKVISSTLIRKKIQTGNIIDANKLLGREWSVIGKVKKGNQRGRLIGFPTCNLTLGNHVLPKLGVYSVSVEFKSLTKQGIANIGYRPTFSGKTIVLEVNIFGINKNLYNKVIKVSFKKFIRAEKKFKSVIQLKKQIKKDILTVKNKK